MGESKGSDEISPPLITTGEKSRTRRPFKSISSIDGNRDFLRNFKQLKDERKSTIDERHKYIFNQLSFCSGLDYNVVEDNLIGDPEFENFNDFFSKNGSQKMTFIHDDNADKKKPQIRIFKDTIDTIEGFFYVFTKDKKDITNSNIAQEVIFSMFEASPEEFLSSISKIFSEIYIPVVKCNEDLRKTATATEIAEELVENLEDFVKNLSAVGKPSLNKQILQMEKTNELLGQYTTPKTYSNAAAKSDLVELVEKEVELWMKGIEQTLAESEQMRQETDDVGPTAELNYWKSRMTKFSGLLEQITSFECTRALLVLKLAKSKLLQKWHKLDIKITTSSNEAKSNVKFLYTLEKYFGPLGRSNPSQLAEIVPGVINSVKMIYSVSQYYNTAERITSLFIKITNQMITCCKFYLRSENVKIWDQPKDELIRKMNECIRLKKSYQGYYQSTKQALRADESEKQFEFSENYIFGKIDSFCKRLTMIIEVIQTIHTYSVILSIKADGFDSIVVRFKAVTDIIYKKSYDILDQRKNEFKSDFAEFQSNIKQIKQNIENFLSGWISRPLSVEKSLELVQKFVALKELDFHRLYAEIFSNFEKELEQTRRIYEKNCRDPPGLRFHPQTVSRILWARQLFKRIEKPMIAFKEIPKFLENPQYRESIIMYNKIASVLIEYEIQSFNKWHGNVGKLKETLYSTLLLKDESNHTYSVNFNYRILELLHEGSYMADIGLEIPKEIETVCARKIQIKNTLSKLQNMLSFYKNVLNSIPPLLLSPMRPFIEKIRDYMDLGTNSLNWQSLNVDSYINQAMEMISNFQQLIKEADDILTYRIEKFFEDIGNTKFFETNLSEPIHVDTFLENSKISCQKVSKDLKKKTIMIEEAVKELISLLTNKMDSKHEIDISANGIYQKADIRENMNRIFYNLLNYFVQKNTDMFIKCTKSSLDTLRKKLQTTSGSYIIEPSENPPFFIADIVFSLPQIVVSPSIEETQSDVQKIVQNIFDGINSLPTWSHFYLQQEIQRREHETQMTEETDDQMMVSQYVGKTVQKQIIENKEISKTITLLNSTISLYKPFVEETLSSLEKYSHLWNQEISEVVGDFSSGDVSTSDFGAKISYYEALEKEIDDMKPTISVGPLILKTEKLKQGLISECSRWKFEYAKSLNDRCAKKMTELFDYFTNTSKHLSRPIKDLDDIRSQMSTLMELRESEIDIEFSMTPIEEAYGILNKHQISFNDGNAEKIDSLSYSWKKLLSQSKEVNENLLESQPKFREELITGSEIFKKDEAEFIDFYDSKGPMEKGITPREASDRLTVFQARFDELWNKYMTYNGGEELFGMAITAYPELQRVKKELNLLQKLYGLYNSVLETVNGYYDIAWTDIDIEKINSELVEFQNKCRKLPKGLKEWEAYEELRKTIDDFNETCPLLEMLSNKAMVSRHWERLDNLTGHKFDVEGDNFMLRDLMKAPLLKYKEDIEDICISAVKEKEIEAKLKQVINDWSVQSFSFGTFKSRGELLLKGDTTSESISFMEDSLMILSSLLGNRYNAPFKPKISEWVHKLTSTTEIIENWLIVQNLWVYLEAVFVGGDIAKQLPQEAKMFSNIDKSWQKIMQRAHEESNIIQCCVGDDTMIQLLPHLLEQLEMCQKSLTGYLEKKRLIFSRFFFVSDPALLEILGQASDPHTIQNHLLSVFDNTKSVTFDQKNYEKITQLHSQEGETIDLEKPCMAQGNVEMWLGDLLKATRSTIHSIIRTANISIQDSNFNLIEFENNFPAQTGLLGLQLIWTKGSEEAIVNSRNDKKTMPQAAQRWNDVLNQLIQITTTDLTKFERTKFETLITIHVHQKDIFDILVKMHVRSINDFEWLKQSRFYFHEDDDKCIISITDVDFSYQNEYLGCTDRLVITPLTDRCYITLAQALGMSLGGAPAGPAGTGKTETTKDMGRCLGKYVVVFNCSDQMDFRGLGRIYKGLAQSGSWGCFDEFNRIELPVLSVAAQQIAIVLSAKKERKQQFIFTDGDLVDLDPEFGLFLTMNPGYAGRQELPENLKINFRTVAMMVPDRGIIIRVKLASAGFVQNVILSKKFFTLYKLCEEQLSKQVHYDFGLRNILSVLRTLGAFKRGNPQDSEPTIVMRVLRDMNVSKLVDEDEPLFMSLIDDLFPGMQLDKAGYPEIESAIADQVEKEGLINHAPWTLKLIQLYETQRVRHGMMALGPSGAGKSKCIKILMKAMTQCGIVHKEMRMNPKAITAPQMFGKLDVATNDWTDGIFSTLWRKTLKAKKGDHIWLILDGPVDAIWIENLNSVLDDNKTLTLANGDRITMSPTCKIIFEVHNIDNASPATVSRNGMVYMSSSIMDWEPILKAWLLTRPASQSELIFQSLKDVWASCLCYVKQNLISKMDILDCNYINQFITILNGMLPTSEEAKSVSQKQIESSIFFSIMWSLGSLLEIPDRYKLQEYIKENHSSLSIPTCEKDSTIFEYVPDNEGNWIHWESRVNVYNYPKDNVPEYVSILIPNVDNTRTDFLINIISKQAKSVLLIGEQGTAKTVMVQGYCNKFDPEQHMFKSMNFSNATTPLMFQRNIESYVEKRMGTTYGPPAGRKMTVFIDDINMPIINEWGDQITNEITRQSMEQKGFYNLEKPGEFTTILDVQFIAAMIHPGGGRNDIPQRLKRQFSIFNCTLPSNISIDKIFKTIGIGYFDKCRNFSDEVINLIPKLIPATRIIWQRVKLKMLPTPAKFHYVFNLRDLSRIWQGMLNVESEALSKESQLVSLWKHECTRVIADRFIELQDLEWFNRTLKNVCEEECGSELTEQIDPEPYFVDFMRDAPEITGEEEEAEIEEPKIYESIPSYEKLLERLAYYQSNYNESVRSGKMDLVFFKDAMTHLVKVSRIIRTVKGHALLVGVGGSGKQSITKLASFIAGYETFQITLTRAYNVSNLMEDLKYLFKTAGHKGKGITFIFTDNEIKDEAFLEYINNMLSSGEIANLFPRDEMDEIHQELIPIMKREFPRVPPTSENLHSFYMTRVRKNLHVVLCFSPVGEKFQNRSLKFPSLITGTTMDWYQRWPKEALIAVSEYYLESFYIECSEQVKKSVVRVMGEFQDFVAVSCSDYFQRFRRQTHVTPKSYLSFINGYKKIYLEKKNKIDEMASRMNTGLQKLLEATESVNILSVELVEKEKELEIANREADEVLKEVTIVATAAEKVKAQVAVVKDKAQAIVDGISADKAVAMEKLKEAEPALLKAEQALQTIKPSHIATVRKLGKPPHLIMRIMDAVLLLFQRKLETVQQDPEKPTVKPSWSEALKLMSSGNFLQNLLNFPKDNINAEMVELMEPILNQEDYTLENAKKVSGDVAGLLSWTEAMSLFYIINRDVLPLKANLKIQEAKLAVAMTDLKSAQDQLDEKQRELDKAQAIYDNAMAKKQALLDDAEACRRKMSNAKQLIDGLSGEKIRWTAASKQFSLQIYKLVGDVLLCTGFLSYGGPFNQQFRNILIQNWKKMMVKQAIPFDDELNIINMLVDNTTISEWNIQGLPNDELSTQNGLIATKAARFPLLIDPQMQGKTWIKNREANGLIVTKLSHKYFRTHLEDSLSQGRPLLIEDIDEELDPALDNVLEKNFIKTGSTFKVVVGDKEIDVMNGFVLYITTKLSNPAFTPEVSARTSIIDFTVTMKGLEDQLLGITILKEKNELEAERTKLFEEVTANRRRMKELEDNLLYRLTTTEGSLVEDDSLIEVLQVTKATAHEVNEKLQIAADTEIKINTAREEFRPVASRGSIMYFLIVEMSMVNVMYQTSLKQFLQLFDKSMNDSPKSPMTQKRIANIIEFLTYQVFCYTQRGFYEEDKFLFTILMTLKIQLSFGNLRHEEFQIFIKGGAALDLNAVEPKPKKWIQDLTWLNLVELSKLTQFSQILSQVARNDKVWKEWFDKDSPEETPLPDGYDTTLDIFRKLLLIRSWCPDRCVPMAKKYVSEVMGREYAEGAILNLEAISSEGDQITPIICFLSMGSDPTDNIEKYCKKIGLQCFAISMGQGQEIHARRLLQQAMQEGNWVILQNCHLGLNFMDELLEMLQTTENIESKFRVWITTEVHPKFSINLLQSSIKFTFEPPQGIKAGIKRTYAGVTQEQLDYTNIPWWRPLLYAVAFLHTTVQERRKFGPIGWNIPYEFNQSDFNATVQFISNYLDEVDVKKGISWVTIRYMISEVQYGGRVTDDFDKILLNTYAKVWFNEQIFSPSFQFYTNYVIPNHKNIEDYRTYIDSLPLVDTPECFGLHPNADITYSTTMANQMLSTIVSIQPKDAGGSGGETRESVVYRMADDMLSKLPQNYVDFEVKNALRKMGHLQPLNIFLRQEVDRIKRVIGLVYTTLNDLKLAIDGTIIMSENLRDALDRLYDARIPNTWAKVSWESATIGFWFTELLERNAQFNTWLFGGRPKSFWMTGFFNPQGFLTAMRQEITRAHKGWALDCVSLSNEILKQSKEDITRPPEEGVYVYGLYLDGADWDKKNGRLAEPQPKVLNTMLPVVHIFATNSERPSGKTLYECPVYKKPRRTDLNYIFNILLKTRKEPEHWTLRGVGVLCDTK